ncbi:hypothetical protein LENED_011653 [Lentinula edodes]|uniref:Uncharacterized protein n=1 Tax=Lentinula edodes TaxID=5353 RepID=A0A1Q3EQL3_LENED|nr:hypothetical protein LENED_011653 [Lentinula edodes]
MFANFLKKCPDFARVEAQKIKKICPDRYPGSYSTLGGPVALRYKRTLDHKEGSCIHFQQNLRNSRQTASPRFSLEQR